MLCESLRYGVKERRWGRERRMKSRSRQREGKEEEKGEKRGGGRVGRMMKLTKDE